MTNIPQSRPQPDGPAAPQWQFEIEVGDGLTGLARLVLTCSRARLAVNALDYATAQVHQPQRIRLRVTCTAHAAGLLARQIAAWVEVLGVDSLEFDDEGVMEISFVTIRPGIFTLHIPGTTSDSQKAVFNVK